MTFLIEVDFKKAKMAVTCGKCGKSLGTKASLLRHIRHVHDGVRDQKCSQCEFDTTDYRILAKHMEKQHGIIKDKSVKVSAKNAKVKGNAKDKAMKVSAPKVEVTELKCMLCDYKAVGITKSLARANLMNHVKIIHGKEKDQKCCLCDYATYDSRLLVKHMEKKHGAVKDKKGENGPNEKHVIAGEDGQKDIREYVSPAKGKKRKAESDDECGVEERVTDNGVVRGNIGPASVHGEDEGPDDPEVVRDRAGKIAKIACALCPFASRKYSKLLRHHLEHEARGDFKKN